MKVMYKTEDGWAGEKTAECVLAHTNLVNHLIVLIGGSDYDSIALGRNVYWTVTRVVEYEVFEEEEEDETEA